MSGPLLSVRGLTAGYGDIVAVRDVDLDVRAAEIVTVLGTNGAGKTTLLGAIAGLVRCLGGSVELDGETIDHLRPHARARTGLSLVQENKRLFRQLSVRDNLVVAAPRLGRDEFQRREHAVHELFPALEEKGGELAGSLSGGQQQMLAIGQALMSRPKVLMLDEPSAGLAPMLVKEVLDRVAEIAAQGIGVVLVEQAVHQALRVASRVYLLRLGVCSEPRDFLEGDPQQLLEQFYLGSGPEVAAQTIGSGPRPGNKGEE
jgi:branched-chain amino acid transport system ATP-binding protein